MSETAARLLSGPRGRRACLEYARSSSDAVSSALFWLGYELAENPGVLFGAGVDGNAPAGGPRFTATEMAAQIGTVDLPRIDHQVLRDALQASVDSARYWQEPDGEDVVASLPEVRASLHPIAELLASAMPNLTAERGKKQWAVDWNPVAEAAPLQRDPAAALAAWAREVVDEEIWSARERPTDPRGNFSGTWWSVPLSVLATRGSVEAFLELVEDSFGWTAATFIPVSGTGTVLEITCAEDWANLCRKYPVEVTASRRHDWFRTTGRHGRWVIPDWERVAQDWDAVHLTALGYYSAATQLVPVDESFGSVIAGWAPDSTLWLRDVAREATAARQEWCRPTEQDKWVRTNPA